MAEIVPLQVYPWPVGESQLTILKEAKASLELETKILPTEAVPGLHGRVLALGKLPPWVCDAALARDPNTVQSVSGALRWVLTAPVNDQRGFMVQDYLEGIFGEGVVELEAPKCACEELGCEDDMAVRNYSTLRGRCSACYSAGCYLTKGLCLRD